MCSDGRILTHQGAINQCLILEQGIKGIENMALMVVPAKGVVLRSRHGKADNLFSSKWRDTTANDASVFVQMYLVPLLHLQRKDCFLLEIDVDYKDNSV